MRTVIAFAAACAFAMLPSGAGFAQQLKKDFIGPVPADASSTAVKVSSGHIIFLAGHTASVPKGSSDYGNFETQFKAAFGKIAASLKASGGTVDDIVAMSVFLTDMRYQPQFAKLAQGLFTKGFPAITYVEVSHLADPQLLMEIQPIAVVP
jgi:enamine deaminase RidA (YjgF/YER057c/UK114 family)